MEVSWTNFQVVNQHFILAQRHAIEHSKLAPLDWVKIHSEKCRCLLDNRDYDSLQCELLSTCKEDEIEIARTEIWDILKKIIQLH